MLQILMSKSEIHEMMVTRGRGNSRDERRAHVYLTPLERSADFCFCDRHHFDLKMTENDANSHKQKSTLRS